MGEEELVCKCLACLEEWVIEPDQTDQCPVCGSLYTVELSGSDTSQ